MLRCFSLLLICALVLCWSCHASQQHVCLVMLTNPPVVHLFDNSLSERTHIYLPSQFSPIEYAAYLVSTHDTLLASTFSSGTYKKLYSYTHLVNGFSAFLTAQQADILYQKEEVVLVERDTKLSIQTTYTPSYLGLPGGAWQEEGGAINAGEGIVIGILDTGIDPTHPSFSANTLKPYPKPDRFQGSCEVAPEFPEGSCNKKLVGAQHFAKAAIASGEFNATFDFASPFDGDGHGTHTASTAAGNNGVEVIVDGLSFGFASGMAPRAHIAVYKALYRGVGGFIADVVAAIEQAVKDKVDILSLSIGPNGPPPGIATYFNIFDMTMLSANKAGVFVVQAAGNAGPSHQSILSFSPWICSVAASVHDRTYPNTLILGNNKTVEGIGLASGTPGNNMHNLILASDALKGDGSTLPDANDCQDPSLFKVDMVQGKVIICSYTIDYIFGGESVNKVVSAVQNLSAVGMVMVVTADFEGELTIPLIPFPIPAIIIPTTEGTKTLLDYYNGASNDTATVRITGSAKAKFGHEAPKVAKFSSRGPDPQNDDFRAADVLKPNIMAPGHMIWAGWSSVGIDSSAYQGQKFAMISGTSMATPHIAGIAALIMKKNPQLSPAALASALATTAFTVDEHGEPLLAQNPSNDTSIELGPATPFDFGGGAVNATATLDPGLVFDAGYEDYVKFLCTIPGASNVVQNATGVTCADPSSPSVAATDLNLPSITIANLTSLRIVPRVVTSIAVAPETYKVTIVEPRGVLIAIKPMEFTIASNSTQELSVTITPAESDGKPSFGHFLLSGSNGHRAHVPISIVAQSS
ncbi:hypothetical protein GOP47_0005222 [Adiantum capillus-veneris]|uniref:Uncharacterized protein n=1 Tax=Adiantum capillus-veneris TaxID=13818 RepID=A0A9D4V5U7_ADICA|nr:hypothetical protein GOP47_0005222 [Adiantum capillus-veneris]